MEPEAEEKFEKRGLEQTKSLTKWDLKSVGPQYPLKGLIHMYPATEFGRSKYEPFLIDDYFLWLFSLEKHQWRIIPLRNALVL